MDFCYLLTNYLSDTSVGSKIHFDNWFESYHNATDHAKKRLTNKLVF